MNKSFSTVKWLKKYRYIILSYTQKVSSMFFKYSLYFTDHKDEGDIDIRLITEKAIKVFINRPNIDNTFT